MCINTKRTLALKAKEIVRKVIEEDVKRYIEDYQIQSFECLKGDVRLYQYIAESFDNGVILYDLKSALDIDDKTCLMISDYLKLDNTFIEGVVREISSNF